MGRLERLPGIDEGNTTRRNAVVTALYALAGIAAIGTVLEESEDDTATERPAPAELHAVSQHWLQGTTSFNGSDRAVTESFEAVRFTTFIYDYAGSGNFVLELVNDETGDTVATLLDEDGPAAGTVGIGLPRARYSLEIEADGEWSVQLGEPLAPEDRRHDPPVAITGERPDVFGKVITNDPVTVTGYHEGESNFTVSAWDEANTGASSDAILFDETGEFDGRTDVQWSGFFYISVEADGPYRIEIG